MTRKRDVVRPYAPEYCSAETLAYRLDISRDKLEVDVRSGLLPQPEEVGTQRRWYWPDVQAWIKARNGKVDPVQDDADPFMAGVARLPFARTHGEIHAKK